MLARTYRITDKFGVVLLKGSVALVDYTLDGIAVLVHTLIAGLLAIWSVLAFILRPFRPVGIFLVNLLLRATGQASLSARQGAGNAMARRAARREMEAVLTEDPLKRQNRVLSALTVILLVALIGAILYATNPARTGRLPLAAADVRPLNPDLLAPPVTAAQPTASNPLIAQINTPVPTATPLPDILSASGAIAYTVREGAQTDIWAVPVGSRTPIRITNSPVDERDPAWSPDGRRIAYASRQDGNWEIYIYEVSTGFSTRMTYDLSFQAKPTWSPDGEYLAYESYQGNNLDIYVLRVDGTQAPIRLPGNSDAPDFSPAWSPDGRRIAFTSLRGGVQDIYVFSLDDQSVVNVTNTPLRNEDHAAWFPDPNSNLIAFSAIDEGAHKVFVKSVADPAGAPQVLSFGRVPSWSPDGSSLIFTVDSFDATQLTAFPYASAAVGLPILPVPPGSYQPVWTSTPLPPALVNSGGLPPASTEPLYIEQENERATDPPYPLQPLPGVVTDNAALSDRVNDSFNALREMVVEQTGRDFLGRLDDAFWALDRPPQPGEERRNWLMTGRAFAITRNSIAGFPPPLEVVREDLGVNTFWRLYVRVADNAQNGQLGEPLRRLPWDFAARTAGDVQAYDQGGRVRSQVPAGYYVDLTQLAEDFGWMRVPAGSDWRANVLTINYWSFRKTGGLDWYSAMREIYPEGQLVNFAPTAQPITAPTQQAPALTIVPSVIPSTPVPAPPDAGGEAGEAAPPEGEG